MSDQSSAVSGTNLHRCLTARSREDLQPLLLSQLSVTSLVHLGEHLLDLNNTNIIIPVQESAIKTNLLTIFSFSFHKRKTHIVTLNWPVITKSNIIKIQTIFCLYKVICLFICRETDQLRWPSRGWDGGSHGYFIRERENHTKTACATYLYLYTCFLILFYNIHQSVKASGPWAWQTACAESQTDTFIMMILTTSHHPHCHHVHFYTHSSFRWYEFFLE